MRAARSTLSLSVSSVLGSCCLLALRLGLSRLGAPSLGSPLGSLCDVFFGVRSGLVVGCVVLGLGLDVSWWFRMARLLCLLLVTLGFSCNGPS